MTSANMTIGLVRASLAAATLLFGVTGATMAGSVSYTEPVAAGLPLKVVTINLNDPDIRLSVILGQNRVGAGERFRSIVERGRPDAAITGTFFDTASLLPTGDIVVGGRLVWPGVIGTGVAIGPNNAVRFVDTRYGRQTDWSGYDTVIRGGPRLIRDGKVWVKPWAEGFRDMSLYRPRIRTALGMKAGRRMVLVATGRPVTLSRLAGSMRALGVVNAVTLDGGSSTGLYWNGRYVARPGRSLTNVLAVYTSAARYAAVIPAIRPVATA